MSRKKCRRKVYALVNPIAHAMEGAAIPSARDLDKLRLLELSALESFRTGHASYPDFKALENVVNLTQTFAHDFRLGGSEAMDIANKAEKALIRVKERHDQGKPLLLDGEGLEALRECWEWHDAQRSQSARSVYEKAIRLTIERIKSGAPGITVLS